jgi:hypothetical protein
MFANRGFILELLFVIVMCLSSGPVAPGILHLCCDHPLSRVSACAWFLCLLALDWGIPGHHRHSRRLGFQKELAVPVPVVPKGKEEQLEKPVAPWIPGSSPQGHWVRRET